MKIFIKNNFFRFIFLSIILIASFLRFYQLGTNPPSLTWDEASLGYNAYSILKTGRDEYGNKFPLSIRSFDDHKPPLYVYLTIPAIALFGLSEFSVRLPSAVIGILSVVVIYFLVKEFLQKWDKKYIRPIALASAFFFAISPWSLQFSRAAFEGNVGLFFLILGVLMFLKSLGNGRLVLFSSISFVLGIYSYHSFRLLIPLLILFLGIIFWQEIVRKKLFFVVFIAVLLILSLPPYLNFFKAQDSGSRLSMVTIFSEPSIINTSIDRINYDKKNNDYLGELIHNRRIAYSLAVVKGYLDHFNPDFLFVHGDGGVQHHAVDMGMLYLWELPFILIGLYVLVNKRNRYALIAILLFLLAPLPSSITTGTPHPVRAIAMMPSFHIFTAVGLVMFIYYIGKFKIKYLIFALCFLFFIFNFLYYMHQYYIHTPIEYGYFWQYGNKEAIITVKNIEEKYEKIIMTYEYDQPYIYYLFHNKIDPKWYQKHWDYNGNGQVDRFKRIIGKYEFRNIDYSKDSSLPKTLLIGTPDEIPENSKIIKKIYFPSGKPAYIISET